MAVVASHVKMTFGDISVAHSRGGFILCQCNEQQLPSRIEVKSRCDADDLIIALMLARDTLWPIGNSGSNT